MTSDSSSATGSLVLSDRRTLVVVCLMFFFSGAAGLVYEVLWLKELGLLFGNTAHAAATTLAAFFLGLGVGAHAFGRMVSGIKRPLRMYAGLEAAVALSALLYFILLDLHYMIYEPLYQVLDGYPALWLFAKWLLAMTLLFLPAFFMGGTLPVIGQYVIPRQDCIGRTGTLVYAVNIGGAGCGALLAGFFLPPWLGFNGAYFFAVFLNLAIAALAWWLDGHGGITPGNAPLRPSSKTQANPVNHRDVIIIISFTSGFISLALQVLWTRMFAQVLQNSVYTFSIIVVTFLLALSAGALVATVLARSRLLPGAVTVMMSALAGLLIVMTPSLFMYVTDNMSYLGAQRSWAAYLALIFLVALVVLFVPVTAMGTVFPYLMRWCESQSRGTGRAIGELAAANTVGALIGALMAGFVFIDGLGLWLSIRVCGFMYFVLALLVFMRLRPAGYVLLPAVVGIVLSLTVFNTVLPVVSIDPARESLLAVWQGSAANVAVVNKSGSLRIKVDNYYTLGSSAARQFEMDQTHIPLLAHHQPERILYIGLGTGITAGAALSHPVKSVVVAELVSEAVNASKLFFKPYVNGLFDDARVKVVTEDGRNYLLGRRQNYDVVIADLFIPWKAGTGSLYTREHYQAVLNRLDPGGMFVQWLPMYQVSKREFGIIAHTMLDVFPQVTIWRGDFLADRNILALIGHADGTPYSIQASRSQMQFMDDKQSGNPNEALLHLMYYCGNLTQAGELVSGYPINRDNRPEIEYSAPKSHRLNQAGLLPWFDGMAMISFLDQVFLKAPVDNDPYLRDLTPQQRQFAILGNIHHRAKILVHQGHKDEAKGMLLFIKSELAKNGLVK